jgi:Subtilase family
VVPAAVSRLTGEVADLRGWFRSLTLAFTAALVSAAIGGQAFAAPPAPPSGRYQSQLTVADVARLSAGATQRSIVIFRNQHPELPATRAVASARSRAIDGDQAQVRSELSTLHAADLRTFHVVNAVAATISKAEADRLGANPAVRAVVPDLPIAAPTRPAAAADAPAVPATASAALQQLCPPDPAVPLLEPEALQLLNVEQQPGSGLAAAHDLADGSGVQVAFIADGVDTQNPDFLRNGTSIFSDYQDFTGEGLNAPTSGAEALGDAASIAAQGNQVYDLSQFVSAVHPLPPGCNIRIKGVAPGVSLVGLKVFGNNTATFASHFVQAIDRAVTVDHVDVINESFGANIYPDAANDPVSLADAAAVQAGVTVVASSGDAGRTSTIGRPSHAAGVISVGGSTQFRLYRQTGSFGSQLSAGGWLSDNISALSSGGFTQFGPQTIDLVAPGDLGWSECDPNPAIYQACGTPARPRVIQQFGGTSESSPLTAGVAAMVIQAYERAHGGQHPTPDLVRQILVSSATDLHVPAEEQGAGLVNGLKAVQTAMSIHDANGSPAAQGDGLLVGPTRLTATAAAGSTTSFRVTVTNSGAAARTVQPSLLKLDDALASNDSGALDLPLATAPTFLDGGGTPSAYELHQFQVPDGAQWLNGDIAWNGGAQRASRVRETLFDPVGRLAAYSLPQGAGGFGHVDVHDPAAGTWTAVIWTQKNGGGYNGTVQFAFTTQRFQSAGTVSPRSRTLAPGATATFNVRTALPAQAGDTSARLVIGTGASDDGSIPVTVRSLVPMGPGGGAFQGILTGGNGRPILGGQTLVYQFDVPAGRPSLDLALRLRDPGYNVAGLLLDPSGEPVDEQTTRLVTAGTTTATSALQLLQRSPHAGRWTAILVLSPPETGAQVQEPFTGVVAFDSLPVTAAGLPRSPATVLPAGQPVTVSIQIQNTGISQKDFFVDARLAQRAQTGLLGTTPLTVQLPLLAGQPTPSFLVPTDADQLTIVASGTAPILMHVAHVLNGPQVEGVSVGDLSIALRDAAQVAPGPWTAFPTEVGPFGTSPAPAVTVNAAAVVDANQFDAAVTASSGDLWLTAVDPAATYTPLTLAPGQSGAITATITPTAPSGTVVHGTLELDTFNPLTSMGDEVVSIPYVYTVG